MLSDLFNWLQECESLEITFTPISDNALRMFSQTFPVISASTWFNSIVSLLY